MPFIRQVVGAFTRVLLVLSLAPGARLAAAESVGAGVGPGSALFSTSAVARFQIEISNEAMAQLRRTPRQEVHVSVRQGEKLYPDTFLHLKGRTGSFRTLDEKPASLFGSTKGSRIEPWMG